MRLTVRINEPFGGEYENESSTEDLCGGSKKLNQVLTVLRYQRVALKCTDLVTGQTPVQLGYLHTSY